MSNHINTYINTSWEHPHLYSASQTPHGIQMGEDYVLRLHHGLRPAPIAVTPDGVYCGECGADVTRAWKQAERGPVADEPRDVDRLLQERDALQAQVNELQEEVRELQEQIDGYDESNTLLSRTVSELQEQLQHDTSEEQHDTPTDPHRLALRAEGAEYALQSLQLRVADMAEDIERNANSLRPDYVAERLRSMLPPTTGDAWGLAGWWATERILGDVHVVDAAADDDGEVEVLYLDDGKPMQGYAYVGALTNWRTTR